MLDALGVPVLRCGALLRPTDREEARDGRRDRRQRAGATASRRRSRDDGALEVPGEAVTDPVAYTAGAGGAAAAAGAEVRTGRARRGDRARGRRGSTLRLADGDARAPARVAVNCAGLHADEVARLAGDESFAIYPRKGEFFVFDPPGGEPLERILLPVPTKRTKGVLVFPTVDGKVVAGPDRARPGGQGRLVGARRRRSAR